MDITADMTLYMKSDLEFALINNVRTKFRHVVIASFASPELIIQNEIPACSDCIFCFTEFCYEFGGHVCVFNVHSLPDVSEERRERKLL